MKAGQWPELSALLGDWTRSTSSEHRKAAIKIFTFLLRSKVPLDAFHAQLIQVYDAGLRDPSVDVRVTTLEGSLDLLFSCTDFKPHFQKAIPQVFEVRVLLSCPRLAISPNIGDHRSLERSTSRTRCYELGVPHLAGGGHSHDHQ